jgi:type II restriction/modification system DNA methylase subunit YeeA
MDVNQFIDKWSRADRTERQAAQEHFIDLCRVLGEPTPNEAADPGAYSFEKGASKIDGSPGFADVWKRGHFGWEYKKDRANLDRAYQQLQLYSVALENPPLLVVSDTKRFRIYTNWTNTVQVRHEFPLEKLAHSGTRELLKNVFNHPERLKPDKTREQVTKDAAREFTTIAERLRMSGHPPEKVAHFLNRLVFCLFAEDVNLLENDLFKRMLDNLAKRRDKVAEQSQRMFTDLFREMRGGGNYGLEHILHFNGGLFDDDTALPLDADSLDILRNIARLDWSAIDPSIFGTLFERILDPNTKMVGAHYTDPDKIMMIVNPVIVRPLTAEWETTKAELVDILSRGRTRDGKPGPTALSRAEARLDSYLQRLDRVRILDPACGSGNFLYLALQSLKDLERRVIVEAHELGLSLRVIHCGPHNVKGIEINPYAAELARTSIWIGNIQWLRRNGFEARKEPVLDNLDEIECRDALVTKNEDGSYQEAEWPEAEFIVGNPPFVGAKLMNRKIGREMTAVYRSVFEGRLAAFTDFVCYWFEKARVSIKNHEATRVGLVATNSIRKNTNLPVLKAIVSELKIFETWSEEQWTVDGANVDVSIVCFSARESSDAPRLNGVDVSHINADLTTGIDLTRAKILLENRRRSFLGIQKSGPFDVPGIIARDWLVAPVNPNGHQNQTILKPYWNGDDLTGRPRDVWFIDMPLGSSSRDAALWEAPFSYLLTARDENGKSLQELRAPHGFASATEHWWEPWRPRPAMRSQIEQLSRYIVTAETAQYRLFVWLRYPILPDKNLIIFPREDDTAFGILHSRFHEAWSLRKGSDLEDRPRYTSSTTFETFPFPTGLTPSVPAKDYVEDPRAIAIAKAAKRLDELRNGWLNPPDLIDIVPEVVPGYPDRILPKTEEAATILKKRTLTNLYNERPQWLADAHRELDAAVAAAYGWSADISEEDALAELLELNLSRAGAAPARDNGDDGDEDAPEQLKAPRLTREEFAKISEVEGLRLSEPMQQAFADFDRRGLSPEERRQAIIDRFKQTAK